MKKRHIYLIAALMPAFCYLALKKTNPNNKTNYDNFSISAVKSELAFNEQNVFAPLTLDEQREVQSALSQNYSFLGAGGQCFAFTSDDGNYVLKLLKFKRRNPPFYASYPMPSFLRATIDKAISTKKDKIERDFNSYRIATNDLKDSTGLLFCHLNKTKNLSKEVQIFDKEQREYKIQLDDFEFLLQRKVVLVEKQIQQFMNNGDLEQAKDLTRNIICAFVDRSLKGIYDDDAKIHRNFGCIGTKIVFIDIGRFRKEESIKDPKAFIEDIKKNTKRFEGWLESNYPALKTVLEEKINDLEKMYL